MGVTTGSGSATESGVNVIRDKIRSIQSLNIRSFNARLGLPNLSMITKNSAVRILTLR